MRLATRTHANGWISIVEERREVLQTASGPIESCGWISEGIRALDPSESCEILPGLTT